MLNDIGVTSKIALISNGVLIANSGTYFSYSIADYFLALYFPKICLVTSHFVQQHKNSGPRLQN